MKKVTSLIFSILFGILMVVMMMFTISSLINGHLSFFNLSFITVQSESMAASGLLKGNTYLIQSAKDYNIGDVIAFNRNDNEIWFHEIIEISENGFRTKGSSNYLPDTGYCLESDILGKLVLPGTKFDILVSPVFKIIFILVIYLCIMGILISSILELLRPDILDNELICRTDHNSLKSEIDSQNHNCELVIVALLMITSVIAICAPINKGFASIQTETIVTSTISYHKHSNDVYEDFTFSNSGVITGYNNNNGVTEIIIPSTTEDGSPVTEINFAVFVNNPTVETIIIPASVTEIGWLNFLNCPKLEKVIIYAENPICSITSIGLMLDDVDIYVPDSVVRKYKNSSDWAQYKNQIHPISELN